MLFVYPAVISDKVDRKYLPGIIKSMELFFLHKIVSDIASSNVKLVINRSRITGKFSEIRMEHKYVAEEIGWDMEFLLEQVKDKLAIVADLDKKIADLEGEPGPWGGTGLYKDQDDLANKQMAAQDATSRYEDCLKKNKNPNHCINYKRTMDDAVTAARRQGEIVRNREHLLDEYRKQRIAIQGRYEGEIDKEKREKEAETKRGVGIVGGAEGLRVDTTITLDLRPTATTVSASVEVRKPERFKIDPFPSVEDVKRDIPISVKIVPIIASNFDDIYSSIIQDYFSNQVSSLFKIGSRKLISVVAKYFSPVAKSLLRITGSKDNVDVFRDIILNKQGIINSSTFKSAGKLGGKSSRYSSSVVVLSSDDIKNPHSKIFKDPNKLQHLYQLGWTSIGIADDKDQEFVFCTGIEGGMCTSIPYSNIYKSLQASDLYKDADQLSRFTSRVVGKFKKINFKQLTAESAAVKLLTIQKVETLFERFGGSK